MSARVMLAKMGDEAGLSRSEADRLIEDVESGMDEQDVETHLQLRGAYDIGLGNLPYEELARRRLQHHLKAVELGAGLAPREMLRNGSDRFGAEPAGSCSLV